MGEETPHHLTIDCKAIVIKRGRTLGEKQLEVEELPSLNPIQFCSCKFLVLEG